MNTDILDYTIAKFRETNESKKHFDAIAFHQYCTEQSINSKDVEEVKKFKYVLENFNKIEISDFKNNIIKGEE